MKSIFKDVSIYLIILMLCAAPSAMAVSISADIVTKEREKVETGKFYLMGQYYRWEFIEDGKPVVIIADREKKVHRVLDMEEKTFFEISSDDFKVLSKDPFKASEYMASKYGSKVEGREKINGINCEKQAVSVQGKKIHSRWFSNDLNFPVKLISYDGGKASYLTELKAIKNVDLKTELFVPPADFKQIEEPGAADKRKREKQIKQEEALPALRATKSTQGPCYVKIGSGGELRIQVDTTRKAYLDITNQAEGESEFTILHYRNGKPLESHSPKAGKLERKGHHSSWSFNDEFAQKAKAFLVDEVRIQVTKGLVYALLRQSGEDRSDFYNYGNLQSDGNADPKRPLTVRITGDNPFGDQTTGKFWLRYAAGGSSEGILFKVENGETLTWDYPAEKGINAVAVTISAGNGRAKINLIQPPYPKEADSEKQTVKKKPQPKYEPKAKAVTQVTVTYPSGTGKPLTSGKDLIVSVTGVSADASGEIVLYSDRKKTVKIDTFKFKLKKNQVESFAVSGEKNVGWATVWVHKGSFKVKLDQSSNAAAASTTKTNKSVIPSTQKTKKAPTTAYREDKSTTSDGTILNGEAPLMEGAKVLKEKTHGPNSSVDFEVTAIPEDVINFYKQALTARGWQAGMSIVQGNVGVLQLVKKESQLMIKAKVKGEKSEVSMALIGR